MTKYKYHLIVAGSWEDLQEQVREHMETGWSLQGGASSTSHSYENAREGCWDSTYEYCQAMLEPISEGEQHG